MKLHIVYKTNGSFHGIGKQEQADLPTKNEVGCGGPIVASDSPGIPRLCLEDVVAASPNGCARHIP